MCAAKGEIGKGVSSPRGHAARRGEGGPGSSLPSGSSGLPSASELRPSPSRFPSDYLGPLSRMLPCPPRAPRKLTLQKQSSRLAMTGHTLQQRQGVAHAIRGVRRELRRREERIDGDDFLQQRRHDA